MAGIADCSALKMRILHFIPSLDAGVGGPARAVIDLCGVLALRGHEVTLLTSNAQQAPDSWHSGAAYVPRIVMLPPPPLPGCTYLGEALQKFHACVKSHDLVHVHGMWEYANVQICNIATHYARPYVVSIHGMLDPWPMTQGTLKKHIYLDTFGKQWLRGASRIHLTVASELDTGVKFFPRELGCIVPLLVDLEPYRELPGPGLADARLPARNGRPRVLFLSRLHPKKGLEVLLQSARVLARRGRDISIVVAGDGDASYVQQLKASAQDLGDRVIFLGMVTGALKLSLYQACDLFALPTQQENFGLVYVEALACGLPVITAPVGSRAQLESSSAAVFVERTPEQFADAIERMLLNPEATARMGRRGRDWVFKEFEPTIAIQRFESLYADALTDERMSGQAASRLA